MFFLRIHKHKVAPHVNLLVEVLEVPRRRVVDVTNTHQIAKLEVVGTANPWVADNSVPGITRAVGVVPAADQIRLAIPRQIDQSTVCLLYTSDAADE